MLHVAQFNMVGLLHAEIAKSWLMKPNLEHVTSHLQLHSGYKLVSTGMSILCLNHVTCVFVCFVCVVGVMKDELDAANMKESLMKLTDHSSSKLSSQASSVLTLLREST